MNTSDQETTVWHSDGHRIYLQLNRSELTILQVICPDKDDKECATGKFECIVEWFLNMYGLECNVGMSEVASDMEIAWSVRGDTADPDLCQVWIIPTNDEAFSAWLSAQTPAEATSEEPA